jgi:outer membrane immunogenic protein
MRNVFGLVAGASLVFAGPTFAADLPIAASPPLAPALSWSGCYGGAGGGWIGSGRNTFDLSPSGNYLNPPVAAPPNTAGMGNTAVDNAALSHSYSSSASSGEAGVQVGCNQQFGAVVFGAEGDWQWSGLSTQAAASYGPTTTDAAHIESVTSKIEWFSTVRARVGYTPVDRVLVYGTAGIAVAWVKSGTVVEFGTVPGSAFFNGASHVGSTNQGLPAPVVGAGAEWAFAANWSVKAEFLYFRLPELNTTSPLIAATSPFAPGYSWATKLRMDESVARVGLNFHF